MDAYFHYPTQVRFWDEDDEGHGAWIGGIAYENYIICGCCGSPLLIRDIYEFTSVDEPIIEISWVDISDEILGDYVEEGADE